MYFRIIKTDGWEKWWRRRGKWRRLQLRFGHSSLFFLLLFEVLSLFIFYLNLWQNRYDYDMVAMHGYYIWHTYTYICIGVCYKPTERSTCVQCMNISLGLFCVIQKSVGCGKANRTHRWCSLMLLPLLLLLLFAFLFVVVVGGKRIQ